MCYRFVILIGMTGDDNHPHIVIKFSYLTEKIETVHFRHLDVSHNNIVPVFTEQIQRLLAVSREMKIIIEFKQVREGGYARKIVVDK